MDHKEIISTWRWRVYKAGRRLGEFATSLGMAKSQFSAYVNHDKTPSLKTFEKIENKLKELGV